MLRKLLLSSAVAFGALCPLAIPTSATAHEFHPAYRYHRAYHVYYHDACRPGWICAGTFPDYRAAWRFGERYRCLGFRVSVR
jgi:hypothetical protein